MAKVKNIDWYELLGVATDADENTIKKAYRKKALSCHPDKNPDNPKAVELFHQLSQALSVLTDEDARKAFDNLLKAKKANKIRNDQLDAKRKKMKDDLEARERAAQYNKDDIILSEKKLAAEIERLQKEGKRQLEEENEKLIKMMEEEMNNSTSQQNQSSNYKVDNSSTKLKVRWKSSSKSNSKYDEDTLRTIFCKYGDVGEIIVLPNKKKPDSFSGLIEMKGLQSAKMAVNIETGFQDNPFKSVKLLDTDGNVEPQQTPNQNIQQPSYQAYDQNPSKNTASSFDDYETLVMRQLRQEEERKRLIEEMKRQDAEDEKNSK